MSIFLTSNEWQWRLARTVAQGVIDVFVANIDLILGYALVDPSLRTLAVAFVMAVLSPVMAELGERVLGNGQPGKGD